MIRNFNLIIVFFMVTLVRNTTRRKNDTISIWIKFLENWFFLSTQHWIKTSKTRIKTDINSQETSSKFAETKHIKIFMNCPSTLGVVLLLVPTLLF